MTLLQRAYPQDQTIEVSIQEADRPKVVGRGLQDSTLYRVQVTIGDFLKIPDEDWIVCFKMRVRWIAFAEK